MLLVRVMMNILRNTIIFLNKYQSFAREDLLVLTYICDLMTYISQALKSAA